jgi:hypothetical protein
MFSNPKQLFQQAATNARQLKSELLQPSRYLMALVLFATLILPHANSLAAIDTTKLQAGSKSVIEGIQAVCIVLIPVLIVAGFGTLTFSGFSDNFRRIAIRIIGFAFMGAIGLFLFAQPLADLIIGSVQTNG